MRRIGAVDFVGEGWVVGVARPILGQRRNLSRKDCQLVNTPR